MFLNVISRKDGKKVVPSDRLKVIDEQSATGFYELVILHVCAEDAGEYSCNALNRFGEAKSTAKVTVTSDFILYLILLYFISKQRIILIFLTDDNELFSLLANQGLLGPGEKPEFQWYKDGTPYDPEERFKVDYKEEADTLSLVFQHVKPEDAGLYTCVAATMSGKISCSAELTVQGSIYLISLYSYCCNNDYMTMQERFTICYANRNHRASSWI